MTVSDSSGGQLAALALGTEVENGEGASDSEKMDALYESTSDDSDDDDDKKVGPVDAE